VKTYRLRQKKSGFTLPELLVAVLIGGIATTFLLDIVAQLLQTNMKETAITETSQDVQKALDYIVSDIRESVYVYENPRQLESYLPDFKSYFGSNVTPILAFWKAQSLSDELWKLSASNTDPLWDCSNSTLSASDKSNECKNLKISRLAYSLVVYLQDTNTDPNWKGKSRIVRYELPKYSNLSNLTWSTGFVDPADPNNGNNNFPFWPRNISGSNLQGPKPILDSSNYSNANVLLDFVDSPNATGVAGVIPNCPNLTDYSRYPSNPDNFNSFFACIRKTTTLGINQDIIVYLRGNAEGKPGVRLSSNLPNLSFRPDAQSQITIRGVIDKTSFK
jgi:prepilin-type N-terminal cleavage/methylation domain-containing protein